MVTSEHEPPRLKAADKEADSALRKQVGGGHYKGLAIQPIEYIHANNIPFTEGCIIKYATRWREKGGVDDLRKIIHFAELLIELESRDSELPAMLQRQAD